MWHLVWYHALINIVTASLNPGLKFLMTSVFIDCCTVWFTNAWEGHKVTSGSSKVVFSIWQESHLQHTPFTRGGWSKHSIIKCLVSEWGSLHHWDIDTVQWSVWHSWCSWLEDDLSPRLDQCTLQCVCVCVCVHGYVDPDKLGLPKIHLYKVGWRPVVVAGK